MHCRLWWGPVAPSLPFWVWKTVRFAHSSLPAAASWPVSSPDVPGGSHWDQGGWTVPWALGRALLPGEGRRCVCTGWRPARSGHPLARLSRNDSPLCDSGPCSQMPTGAAAPRQASVASISFKDDISCQQASWQFWTSSFCSATAALK